MKRQPHAQRLITLLLLLALLLPIIPLYRNEPGASAQVSALLPAASAAPDNTYTISDRVTDNSGDLNPGIIVINEIMFFPVTGEHDWVELKNIGGDPIEINGYRLTNENDHWYEFPENLPPVPPGAFVVVVFDGMGSSNNDLDFTDNLAVLHTQSRAIAFCLTKEHFQQIVVVPSSFQPLGFDALLNGCFLTN